MLCVVFVSRRCLRIAPSDRLTPFRPLSNSRTEPRRQPHVVNSPQVTISTTFGKGGLPQFAHNVLNSEKVVMKPKMMTATDYVPITRQVRGSRAELGQKEREGDGEGVAERAGSAGCCERTPASPAAATRPRLTPARRPHYDN